MTAPSIDTAFQDFEAAERHIRAHTSSSAYVLHALTEAMDDSLHHVVLDPETRTVWYAYDNDPLDNPGWSVEQLAPDVAAKTFSDYADTTMDALDDIEGYATTRGLDGLESDQETLDDYTAILRLTLPAEPDQAVAQIRRTRALIARQDTLWQRTYGQLVRDLAGDGHGGKARAGRAIGVTDVQVGRIIREDDRRREALVNAVKEMKDELDNG